jgi:hypothetical protein
VERDSLIGLPAKFGELIAAMIENLEAHQETLEVTDENGKPELHAYVKLSQEFRCIATQLQATAADMAGYRDLPMARHDPAKMSSPKVVDAFTKFVRLENDLLALLRQSIERDRTLLATMTGRAA